MLSAPDAVALALLRHARPKDEEREELLRRAREAFGDKFDPADLEPAPIDAATQPQLFAGGQRQETGGATRPQCPDCYGALIFSEGCMMCLGCGYSKC